MSLDATALTTRSLDLRLTLVVCMMFVYLSALCTTRTINALNTSVLPQMSASSGPMVAIDDWSENEILRTLESATVGIQANTF